MLSDEMRFLLTAFAALQLSAGTGGLQLTVIGEDGKPIPGAGVVAIGPSARMAATDQDGAARLFELAPGTYQVEVALSGFNVVRLAIEVGVGRVTERRQVMRVGALHNCGIRIRPPRALDLRSVGDAIAHVRIASRSAEEYPIPTPTGRSVRTRYVAEVIEILKPHRHLPPGTLETDFTQQGGGTLEHRDWVEVVETIFSPLDVDREFIVFLDLTDAGSFELPVCLPIRALSIESGRVTAAGESDEEVRRWSGQRLSAVLRALRSAK
jgi:hypothetical protein